MNNKAQTRAAGVASIEAFLGDMERLTGQLGLARADWGALGGGALELPGSSVQDASSLVSFLSRYRATLLVPVELPTIIKASQFVERGATEELLTLDQGLDKCAELIPFSEASRWVGQCHARSMRGMRDNRTVWRYCDAVRVGTAFGWHPLVYGVVLGAFAVPLHQGLANYCEELIGGFIGAATDRLSLRPEQVAEVRALTLKGLEHELEESVRAHSGTQLRLV